MVNFVWRQVSIQTSLYCRSNSTPKGTLDPCSSLKNAAVAAAAAVVAAAAAGIAVAVTLSLVQSMAKEPQKRQIMPRYAST